MTLTRASSYMQSQYQTNMDLRPLSSKSLHGQEKQKKDKLKFDNRQTIAAAFLTYLFRFESCTLYKTTRWRNQPKKVRLLQKQMKITTDIYLRDETTGTISQISNQFAFFSQLPRLHVVDGFAGFWIPLTQNPRRHLNGIEVMI